MCAHAIDAHLKCEGNRKQPGIILISRALDRNHWSCEKWFGQERTPVLAPKSFHQNDRGVEPQERVETVEETLLRPSQIPIESRMGLL